MPRSLVRNPTAERRELFKCNLDKYMGLRHKSNTDMAAMLMISKPTFVRKKGNPEQFTYEEILRIMDHLKFSPFDKAEVIGIKLQIVNLGGE